MFPLVGFSFLIVGENKIEEPSDQVWMDENQLVLVFASLAYFKRKEKTILR